LARASIFGIVTILGGIKVRVEFLPNFIVENLKALSILCKITGDSVKEEEFRTSE
jgi:hypothetical protein